MAVVWHSWELSVLTDFVGVLFLYARFSVNWIAFSARINSETPMVCEQTSKISRRVKIPHVSICAALSARASHLLLFAGLRTMRFRRLCHPQRLTANLQESTATHLE